MKYFIITIDTEGDNLWQYNKGQEITTENTLYIPRFQMLCEKYGFKPVWLTNYEMVCDDRFVEYLKPKCEAGLCEIGIHIHAWNNPPFYQLDSVYNGNSYLIEYPYDIMRAKFNITYNLLKEKFGIEVKSHRAGRWAMNENYFNLLKEFGIQVDCSFTPGVSWENTPGETLMGTDYSRVPKNYHNVLGILELPMTIRKVRYSKTGSIKNRLRTLLFGKNIWLRPATFTAKEMIDLCKIVQSERDVDYLELMLHSSELMPNGSPYFKDDKSIERLYQTLEEVFSYVSSMGYVGITMVDYYNRVEKK